MLREEWEALSSVFSFFTRLPLQPREFRLERGVLYLPLVGLFIGGVCLLLIKGFSPLLKPPLLAFVVLVTSYWLADYFHFDGLIDTVDALAAGGDPKRRLTILKTPEVGALGLLFAFFFLLGEYLLACELLKEGQSLVFGLRPVVGRQSLALLALLGEPAKRQGLGSLFLSTSRRRLRMIQLIWLPLLFLAPLPSSSCILLVLFLRTKFKRSFSGITGDLLGATVMLAQWLFLMVSLVGGQIPAW